jgi:hypothetical protein
VIARLVRTFGLTLAELHRGEGGGLRRAGLAARQPAGGMSALVQRGPAAGLRRASHSARSAPRCAWASCRWYKPSAAWRAICSTPRCV